MADPTNAPKKPIVIVGMMGAGKSTVGRGLAERLGLPFVDSDAEIEAQVGLSVAEIFERFGEARFREEERRTVARLLDGPVGVIATGGGAFADPDTRALILERGIAVWLDVPLDTLAERVGGSTHRPLLNGGDPRLTLERLMAERAPFYAQAHLTIRGDQSPERIALALAEA